MGFLGFLEVVITSNLGGPVGGLVGWVRFQGVMTFRTGAFADVASKRRRDNKGALTKFSQSLAY